MIHLYDRCRQVDTLANAFLTGSGGRCEAFLLPRDDSMDILLKNINRNCCQSPNFHFA
jgi:hypothetical protein